MLGVNNCFSAGFIMTHELMDNSQQTKNSVEEAAIRILNHKILLRPEVEVGRYDCGRESFAKTLVYSTPRFPNAPEASQVVTVCKLDPAAYIVYLHLFKP